MKRLIPAAIILVFTILICTCANIYVTHECNNTLKDIDAYFAGEITSPALEKIWQERKENMSFFVNHGFLDNISLYIGQLTVTTDKNSPQKDVIFKNIESTLRLIKAEQKFALHSFY